ncbi:MAG: capsular biosynthesis protein [Opitutales bacterium]
MPSNPTVVWLAEHRSAKDERFRAIAAIAGRGQRLRLLGWSPRDFPETRARAEDCLNRAKRQPHWPLIRFLKQELIRGQYNWARRFFERHPASLALCWNGLTGSRRAFMEAARDAGAARLFAELAPFPDCMTLDPHGVNAEGSVPGDPAAFDRTAPDHALIASVRNRFSARASRRVGVGQAERSLAGEGPFLFVPLQVANDSQLRLFAGWVNHIRGFINALAKASASLPEGWHIRFKEHPSSSVSIAERIDRTRSLGARIQLDNTTDSFCQLRASKAVITINSSMGLQAFFEDKPVLVTGSAFWALPGMAHRVPSQACLERLCAQPDTLTFDPDLRARFLTWLLHYYYVPVTQGATGAEVCPQRVAAKLNAARAESAC